MIKARLIRFVLFFFIFLLSKEAFTQLWKAVDNNSLRSIEGIREITPEKYQAFSLDKQILANFLTQIPKEGTTRLKASPALLEVPLPNGKIETFHVVEYQMMEKALADRYPEFKTVRGISVDQPSRRLRMDWTDRGFRGMITGRTERIFIDPVYRENQELYQSYYKSDYQKKPDFICTVDAPKADQNAIGSGRSGDCGFRAYRLAVATTGEYSNFFGVTSAAGESTILSEVTTAVNRVNDVYEADVTLRMILIANTVDVFYYNGSTDPYSNGSGSTMLSQNQTTCDNVIGSANYDIGHVFSTGGGGVATLRGPCGSNKARGVTGQSSPINDPFYIDYVAHEMGHQFGGNHTQNNNCNRNSATAMEPGSASTIMGYAGICNPNVQSNSDAYFHGVNIQEINNFISNGNGDICDTLIPFINSAPTVIDQGNYTIPISTPFMLTADAADTDGLPLLYCWEQWDNETGSMPPQSTNTLGPMFRSFTPDLSPTRYFPRLSDLVNNTSFDWEELPSVSRDMEFRVTIRDQIDGVGCTTEDNLVVSTDASAGPFIITSPGANVTWLETEEVTIAWNVANTDQGSVNCDNVDILLSYDGGFTYPIAIASNVPNDGMQSVTIPQDTSTQARIMVKCSDNIFFDISDHDITIEIGAEDFTLTAQNSPLFVCEEADAAYQINVNSIAGYSDPVSLTLNNVPPAISYTILQNPVTPGNSVTIFLEKLTELAPGSYALELTGTSTIGTKNLPLDLIKPVLPGNTVLLSPENGETSVSSNPLFEWSITTDAFSYTLEYSENADFSNSTIVADIQQNSYQSDFNLPALSTFFWRVKGINNCYEGPWSSAFSFSTRPCISIQSTDVPVDISSGNPNTVTSDISFPNSGVVDDIDVALDISHTYTGDLRIELTSPGNQTVRLLERICGSSNNIDMILDDEAPNNSYPCPATDGNAYQPNESLSAFDGGESNGTWQLTVFDLASVDGGAINGWSMDVCFSESCQLLVDENSGAGNGTLSSAIACASAGDTIFFDPAIEGDTIRLSTTLLVSKNIYLKNVNGQMIYITTNVPERVMEVTNGIFLGLENVTIIGNGNSSGTAIFNNGSLYLKNTDIKKPIGNQMPVILNKGPMEVFGNCIIDQ